jgi:hypothetical protein
MKFEKDELVRLGLALLFAGGFIYAYFSVLLGPLHQKQTTMSAAIAELDPKIAAAREVISKAEAADKSAPAARRTLAQIEALMPEGSPVAWFPPRVADFFRGHGVEKSTTRLVSEGADKVLPDFQRIAWNLDFPKIDYVPFALALAEFENQELLVEVLSLTLEANRDDVSTQHATLTLSNTSRK